MVLEGEDVSPEKLFPQGSHKSAAMSSCSPNNCCALRLFKELCFCSIISLFVLLLHNLNFLHCMEDGGFDYGKIEQEQKEPTSFNLL